MNFIHSSSYVIEYFKNTNQYQIVKKVLLLEIENFVDKIFEICEEALNGNVSSSLHLWQLTALCRAAHYSDFICSNYLSQFKKVITVKILIKRPLFFRFSDIFFHN